MRRFNKRILFRLFSIAILSGLISLLFLYFHWPLKTESPPKEIDPLAPYVKAEAVWAPLDFHKFLCHCNPKQIGLLEYSLNLASERNNLPERITAIQKDFIWESSNIAHYPFRDTDQVDYHKTVQWVAKKQGIPKEICERESTFILERRIFENIFRDMWEKLTVDQRTELLIKIDTRGQLDIQTLSAASGTAALATLATTAYFAGFTFYTTMSTAIFSVAGIFGVSLPFGAYAGASTAVAVLSGPVGWALVALGAAGSVALLGRADLRETTAFIIQVHTLKAAALKNSGWDIPELERGFLSST
jgi:uncharacterized protein YaaW (UPF0174 family)